MEKIENVFFCEKFFFNLGDDGEIGAKIFLQIAGKNR